MQQHSTPNTELQTGLAGRSAQHPQHEQAGGRLHSRITFGNLGVTAAISAQNAGRIMRIGKDKLYEARLCGVLYKRVLPSLHRPRSAALCSLVVGTINELGEISALAPCTVCLAAMHRIFQNFIDLLATAEDLQDFSKAMADTATALDLSCFAYLAVQHASKGKPRLISTYPSRWVAHYLRNNYQVLDPVIEEALRNPEPFRWGANFNSKFTSKAQHRLFEEAAEFGIRFGFTVPIHDGHGPIAALTFAVDQSRPQFERFIESHERALQIMAMYFHAHIRRKLANVHDIEGACLSPREFECLEWAARGKSAWEIGCILGISRNTVAFYLEGAKKKLGVRTIVQAVARLAAAKRKQQN